VASWDSKVFIRCKLQILTRSIGHLGIFCPLFYEQSIVNSDMILLSQIDFHLGYSKEVGYAISDSALILSNGNLLDGWIIVIRYTDWLIDLYYSHGKFKASS